MRFLIGIILNGALIFTLLAPLVVEALVADTSVEAIASAVLAPGMTLAADGLAS